MNSEAFLFSLVEDVQKREHEQGIDALDAREKVLFFVWELEAQVNNGGFNQYFFNSGSNHAAPTEEALRAIGAVNTASLLKEAMDVFGNGGPSPMRDERQNQLEAMSDEQEKAFDRLDEQFYLYPDDLSKLLAAFMQAE